MPQSRTSSPFPEKSSLWKEAWDIVRNDPDDCAVYNKFREIINAQCGRGTESRLSSDGGRKKLLSLIDQRRASMESRRTSTKVDQVCRVADKTISLVSVGAASNPYATVVVAGLSIAFEARRMYTDAAQAMLDIAIDTADIICRCAVESEQAHGSPKYDSEELLELRERLRGSYVQLYRTVLLLSMKLVRTLDSRRRTFLAAWADWPGERENLEKAENRVTKSLESIHRYQTNSSSLPPNWREKKRTALHNAALYGQQGYVYQMIQSGRCDKEMLNARTARKWTALMFAVESGHFAIMEMLLDCKGISVDAKNTYGKTALHMAALKNRTAMMRKLLAKKASVDERDVHGRTAFLNIAKTGYLEAMKLLRSRGANIDQVTEKNGWSALHTAVEGDQLETVQWLLQEGIDREIKIQNGKRTGLSAKQLAVALKKEEIFQVLAS